MTMYDFDAKLPTSSQWNAGIQMALPWASVLDLSYVGQRGQNLLNATDVNAPDFGAAYLPRIRTRPSRPRTFPGRPPCR